MAASFFTVRKDSVLAAGSANFSTKISASATTYGLTAAQASSYAAVNSAFQAAMAAATAPSTRTKGTVAAKDAAAKLVRKAAADLAKFVDGTTSVTAQQRLDLGLNVRKTPSHPGDPGTAYKFKASLTTLGGLDMTWTCTNPAGGTMYQVFRKIGAGEATYLGGTGTKKFTDDTLPVGAANVTYMVQAVRSSGVGAWANFDVKIGVGAGPTAKTVVATTAAAETAPPVKMAA